MADERFEVEFVSRVGSYEQGVQLLVRSHALLAQTFNRTSREGDRLEKQMVKLAGGQQRAATSAQQTATAMNGAANASPRLRYALYDVSSTATYAGAALLGLSVATAAVAIRFQRNFADVARVSDLSGAALQRLREDFNDLYRTLPVAFQDLTRIGTLAGQLDIAGSNIAAFTAVVAKFSATSNVSVEQSATAMGRLAQLLPDVGTDYEGLADAILKVGANSVATEAQIIAISSQLAGVATTANLSSKELIALAGTLASVGTAPELSRGAITRLFANIESSIAAGGERLQAFATVSGRTADEFKQDWGSDSFTVIQDLFEGIGSAGGDMGGVLRTLGIVASRDIPVFQKLAQNTDLLAAAFDHATNSAGEVNRQYNIIASTTAEKINILVNNFNSLAAAIGESALALGPLIDLLIYFTQRAQEIAEGPLGPFLTGTVLTLTALAGAALLAFGAIVRLGASALAVRLAMTEMGLATATSTITLKGMAGAMFGIQGASLSAAAGVVKLRSALLTLGKASVVLLGITEALSLISNPGGYQSLSFLSDGLTQALEAMGVAAQDAKFWAGELQHLLNYMNAATFFRTLGEDIQNFFRIITGAGPEIEVTGKAVEGLTRASADLAAELAAAELDDFIDAFTSVEKGALAVENAVHQLGQSFADNGTAFDRYSTEGRENMGALLDVIDKVAAQTPGDAATTAANLQALFNTLVQGAGVSAASLDFLRQMIAALASQGGGVGSATIAFNGLFNGIATGGKKAAKGAGGAAKEVRTLLDYAKDLSSVVNRSFDIRFGSQAALDKITTSWMDLNEEIDEYQRKVAALTADRAIKSYFLEVAELYGDALRAGVLRSEIADIDAELAEATAGASKELVGNSKAANTNRKRITDLLDSYGDYIEALAAGGASQAELNAAVAQSRSDFLAQAQALGYSDSQLVPYIAHFNDMATAIARVPRNITVTAYTDPALQALAELEARARQATNGGAGYTVPVTVAVDNSALVRSLTAQAQQLEAQFQIRPPTGSQMNALQLIYSALRNARGYATGGYTGNGGKYEPKGVVHGGEFVFDKRATANAGVGRLYAMMKAFRSGKGYAMGGYVPAAVPVGSGGGVMGLGPDAMRELRGIKEAIREIRPGYLFPEDVSRISQEGDRRRRNAGDL